jgi:hypothetical protein
MTTPIFGISEISTGQNQKETQANTAFRRIEALGQPGITVTSAALNAAPGSPAEGAAYIVASAPPGGDAWATLGAAANDLVFYSNGAWQPKQTPRAGWNAYDVNTSSRLYFNGSAWITLSGGAGPAAKEDAATVVGAATAFNFKGARVTASGAQADIDLRVNVPAERTGASETLALTDRESLVRMNNASAQTLTVPANASVAFVVGTVIIVKQMGAGQTTIAAAGGVNLRAYGGNLKLAGQYAEASLTKIAADEWAVSGNLVA